MFYILSSLILLCFAPGLASCHGPVLGIKYIYSMETEMVMNNNDMKEPTGFGLVGEFHGINVWQTQDEYLLKLQLDWVQFKSRKGAKFGDGNKIKDWNKPLYVRISQGGLVLGALVHQEDVITAVNLKKTLAQHLISKNGEKNSHVEWTQTGQQIVKKSLTNNSKSQSILLPDFIDEWQVNLEVAKDHPVVIESNGWQNITLSSRIYQNAHSKLYNNFHFKLIKEQEDKPIQGSSIESVIKSLGQSYIESPINLESEVRSCQSCKPLKSLVKDYKTSLADSSIAKIPQAIGYLKILEQIRQGIVAGGDGDKESIASLLKSYKKNIDILETILDVIAGSRTEHGLNAAIEFLNFPKTDLIDPAERFLILLAASTTTSSQMDGFTSRFTLTSAAIAKMLLTQSQVPKWSSRRLKDTILLVLGTILRSHFQEAKSELASIKYDHQLEDKIITHLVNELDNDCPDSDCRIVVLHAIGNSGIYGQKIHDSLKRFVLQGKRESIAAMKSMKNCVEFTLMNGKIDQKLMNQLVHLLVRVVYDHRQETTSRLIAAELISKHLNDEKASHELIKNLPGFGNNELATIIWTKAFNNGQTVTSSSLGNNWHLHSTTFNGSSAAFKKVMGGTKTINASYQITMELLKGKLLKESSFDVDLTDQFGNSQPILSVGLYARGLSSLAGDSNDVPSGGEEETTMAGMALQILNFNLRPILFFTGTGELMGHVWSGTASEPTSAFKGNILVSDYYQSASLINGFLVEQQLRGALSLDLSGEIQISLWNRNSHSVVHTNGAILFQGSQSIFTSEKLLTSASKQFSFGGETKLDFVTDLDFYSSPFKMCMQLTQPGFLFRHNTRKYEQVQSEKLHRRIHRRFYKIAPKSYALHRDNNEMCSIMNPTN